MSGDVHAAGEKKQSPFKTGKQTGKKGNAHFLLWVQSSVAFKGRRQEISEYKVSFIDQFVE